MNNATTNKTFLDTTDALTKTAVLSNIAKHYRITSKEAYEEVTDKDAEHLLDYITGPEREATYVLMQRRGLV